MRNSAPRPVSQISSNWRFTFERIHNTKEQIYFYERAENHEAKERLFESFKWANFLSEGVASSLWILSFILIILWKWNYLVSSRPNYFIFIEYLIAGRVGWGVEPWTPPRFTLKCAPNHLLKTEQCWPLQVIDLSKLLFKGHSLLTMVLRSFYTLSRCDFCSNVLPPLKLASICDRLWNFEPYGGEIRNICFFIFWLLYTFEMFLRNENNRKESTQLTIIQTAEVHKQSSQSLPGLHIPRRDLDESSGKNLGF